MTRAKRLLTQLNEHRIISSQRYLDPEIVAQKIKDRDFTVHVAYLPDYDMSVVIDGHHSLAAAQEEGVPPNWEDAGDMINADLARLGDDEFLKEYQMDDDYYDIETGKRIWQ
jgi:hypothetical protein